MGAAEGPEKPISLFYSYSHRDEELRKKLEEHLAALRRSGLITEWHDRMIEAGDDWKDTIDARLNSASIILLLVSASFINSDYVWDVEMKRALERHDRKEARVIPVILSPCLWFETPMARLQAVPKDARPITNWPDPNQAFYEVALAVRNCVAGKPLQNASTQGRFSNESEFLSQMTSKMINAKSSWELKEVLYRIDAHIRDYPNSFQALLLRDRVDLSMRNAAQADEGFTYEMGPKSALYIPFSPSELRHLSREVDVMLARHPEFKALFSLRQVISVVLPELADFAVFRDIDAPWCPEMVALPAGQFLMGSPDREGGPGPQHRVTIEHRFALGRYPVTVGEYLRFVEASRHRHEGGMFVATRRQKDEAKSWRDPGFAQTDCHPVVGVSWRDAIAYSEWLGSETGKPYRLPSEAEWEYACRAGTTTHYTFGDKITPEDANYAESKPYKTTEVGAYPANPWGLYDVHGNVWEWVEDVWHDSYNGAPTDGSAWTDGEGKKSSRYRVIRSGSWIDVPWFLRSATRNRDDPDIRINFLGFRVARTLD